MRASNTEKEGNRSEELAPWFHSELHALKQTSRKPERKWRSTSLEESRLVWKDDNAVV